MKTRKRLALARLALASIAFLVAGAVGFSDAAVASPQRDTTASMIAHDAPGTPDRELRSTWRPYDNSAITTPDGCESPHMAHQQRRLGDTNSVEVLSVHRPRVPPPEDRLQGDGPGGFSGPPGPESRRGPGPRGDSAIPRP